MRYLVVLLFISPVFAQQKTRWQVFCQKYLIADDPYQFETYSNDTIIDLLDRGIRSDVLTYEALSRYGNLGAPENERERMRAAIERARLMK